MMRAVLMLALVATGVHEQADQFVVGNAHYEAGRFDSARAVYEDIVADGHESAALYYNLGNAHFKLGDLGQAALGYERALRLDPGHEDAAANLDLVASLSVDEFRPLPTFWLLRLIGWWIQLLPAGVLAFITASAYLGCGTGLVLLILGRTEGVLRAGRALMTAGVAASLLFALTLGAREFRWGQAVEAIVVVDEVTARSAPVEDASLDVFTIHEATKVRVDDRADDWVEIVLPDGQVGWVRAAAVETI